MRRLTHDDLNPASETAEARSRRGNRRRLFVFLGSFAVAMLAGQGWNYSRPAEYRGSLRLQITLPDAGGAESAASSAFANRMQLLNRRSALAQLAAMGRGQGVPLPASDEEAITQLQQALEVQPLPGSDVLRLVATWRDPRHIPLLLNAWPEVVREEVARRQKGEADERLSVARSELQRLDDRSGKLRARLDQFRQRAGVEAERDENEAISVSKGLATSINTALEKEAVAAARLRAVSEAASAGRVGTEIRRDATLSSLEAKAHQVREELREMERTYTPAFMAMDPRAIGMRTRLTELERQIERQRDIGLNAALQTAREDLSAAQAQVARLRERQAAARPIVRRVSAHVAEAKVIEDDLQQVEKARRDLLERVARLESSESRRRTAQVTVIEPAVAPTSPFRPDHVGDGLWILGGSTALALLMMGLVEVFNRPPPPAATAAPAHTTLVLSPGWNGAASPALGAGPAPMALQQGPGGAALALPQAPAAPVAPAAVHLLPAADVDALLAAAHGPSRLACVLALMGLTPAEALALTAADVDCAGGVLRVGGSWARRLPLPAWIQPGMVPPTGTAHLLSDAHGQPLADADLQAMVAGASLDAGLPDGAALGWRTLRHTAIAALLDQGLRFSELPVLVGRVDAELLAALSARQTRAPNRGVAEVDPLLAALRRGPAA